MSCESICGNLSLFYDNSAGLSSLEAPCDPFAVFMEDFVIVAVLRVSHVNANRGSKVFVTNLKAFQHIAEINGPGTGNKDLDIFVAKDFRKSLTYCRNLLLSTLGRSFQGRTCVAVLGVP